MSCPGCGENRFRVLSVVRDRLFRTTEKQFEIARCSACALEFLHPTPDREEIAAFYPKGYHVEASSGGTLGWLTEIYRRLVLFDHLRFVRTLIDVQKQQGTWLRLLDLGCGDGSFLDALDLSSCFGLDGGVDAVRAASARRVSVVRGRLEAVPLRERSFSVVTMFHVLEHVSPAGPYLEAVRSLLAPDGRLVVQVPNVASWQCRLFGGHWGGYDPPRHLVNYSPRTLGAVLERHGFAIVRSTHFSLRDNSATLANSLVPTLYPPARSSRVGVSHGAVEWAARLTYLSLVLAAIPFTLVESALRHGAALMVEARPV